MKNEEDKWKNKKLVYGKVNIWMVYNGSKERINDQNEWKDSGSKERINDQNELTKGCINEDKKRRGMNERIRDDWMNRWMNMHIPN